MTTDGGASCAKGPATTGGGMSGEFPEGGTVGSSREAKGDRGGLGGGATVNGLGAWEVAEVGSTVRQG